MRPWVMLGLVLSCQSAEPAAVPKQAKPEATSPAPKPPASIDDSMWLRLERLTGVHAPVGKVVIGGEGCVKDRPCPFVPA